MSESNWRLRKAVTCEKLGELTPPCPEIIDAIEKGCRGEGGADEVRSKFRLEVSTMELFDNKDMYEVLWVGSDNNGFASWSFEYDDLTNETYQHPYIADCNKDSQVRSRSGGKYAYRLLSMMDKMHGSGATVFCIHTKEDLPSLHINLRFMTFKHSRMLSPGVSPRGKIKMVLTQMGEYVNLCRSTFKQRCSALEKSPLKNHFVCGTSGKIAEVPVLDEDAVMHDYFSWAQEKGFSPRDECFKIEDWFVPAKCLIDIAMTMSSGEKRKKMRADSSQAGKVQKAAPSTPPSTGSAESADSAESAANEDKTSERQAATVEDLDGDDI